MVHDIEHVLVVDDDREILETTGELLRLRGFVVSLASSGDAALAMVRRGLVPHLVVADENMPGTQGHELARLLREEPGLEGVPVLIATGNRPGLSSWPPECVLEKPFGAAELYDRIELLALRAAGARASRASRPGATPDPPSPLDR